MEVRAARLVRHGEPLEIDVIDLAEPGPGEVLVELAYSGINPVDRYALLGSVAADGPLPRTLGTEGAGLSGGRRVVVRGHGIGTGRDGLWATAAVVPHEALIDVPEGVDLERAAAIGVAGVTAWRCVTEKARVTPEDRVLVLGAAGGVGSVVVSVVHAIGATVWGQTGNEANLGWIRARGADNAVVAQAHDLISAASELRPTVVFDPLGDGYFGAAVTLLEGRGRLVIFGTSAAPTGEVPLQQIYRKGLTIYGYGGIMESDDAIAEGVRQALDAQRDGRLDVVVDRALPLDQINDAFELLVKRKVRGKLLVDLKA